MKMLTECFVTENDLSDFYNLSLDEVRAKLQSLPESIKTFVYLKSDADCVFTKALNKEDEQNKADLQKAKDFSLKKIQFICSQIRNLRNKTEQEKKT